MKSLNQLTAVKTAALATVLMCGFLVTPVRAAILTFESAPASVVPIDQAYGDNVATLPSHGVFTYGDDGSPTPNVALSYTNTSWYDHPSGNFLTFPTPFQDPGVTWSYTFSAEPGFFVSLSEFEYSFGPAVDVTFDWEVRDGAATLLDSGMLDFTGNAHASRLTESISATASELTLQLEVTHSEGNGFGLTDIAFTQSPAAVPEPSTFFVWSLLGLTLSGAYRWRRRR
jgi:hypothetical protein